MPSRHNTPCHRHDNWAVANTTRYPEGATSRTLTGPEGTRRLTEGGQSRGGTKQGESDPSRSNPYTKSRTKQPRKRQQQKQKGNRNPATPQTKATQKIQGPQDTGHKGTTRAGRSKQAARYRPQHTTWRRKTDKEETKKTKGQSVNQSLKQEARRNATMKRNELRSTSAPAQSADRNTSTRTVKIYL